ncbi:MAG: MBL fold metallo-hydrolase [Terriglobales bacterium]
MYLRILGSAAGGRFPQWNCGCENCSAIRGNFHGNGRHNEFAGKSRTQAQLAVSADGVTWFLAGACPDLPFQIEANRELHPCGPRDSPIAGVVLGSADLDHVVGLLLLRELQPLRVYAAPSILRILREENSMFGMLNRAEHQVVWTPMNAGASFPLLDAEGQAPASNLQCEAYYLAGRYPQYAKSSGLAPDEGSAALFFTVSVNASSVLPSASKTQSAKRVAYLPAVGKLDDALIAKIDGSDILLFDGTFWSDDELMRIESSGETAHQMGHIPVEESLQLLKNVKAGRRIYIHINNTNPILDESGPEHRAVRAAGWEVAEDNWHLAL